MKQSRNILAEHYKYSGEPFDALLVLGRGIDSDGTLNETGLRRTRVAIKLARTVLPRVVVFSGGRSWKQALAGILPPSEGGAMLHYAQELLQSDSLDEVDFLAEETSESTVANMVNSKPLLNLMGHEALGLLSDELHFSKARPQHIAERVFPGTRVTPVAIENTPLPTPEEIAHERHSALVTKLLLAGVSKGNDKAIMRRQRLVETLNKQLRQVA